MMVCEVLYQAMQTPGGRLAVLSGLAVVGLFALVGGIVLLSHWRWTRLKRRRAE